MCGCLKGARRFWRGLGRSSGGSEGSLEIVLGVQESVAEGWEGLECVQVSGCGQTSSLIGTLFPLVGLTSPFIVTIFPHHLYDFSPSSSLCSPIVVTFFPKLNLFRFCFYTTHYQTSVLCRSIPSYYRTLLMFSIPRSLSYIRGPNSIWLGRTEFLKIPIFACFGEKKFFFI